jgi:hypothetical protein
MQGRAVFYQPINLRASHADGDTQAALVGREVGGARGGRQRTYPAENPWANPHVTPALERAADDANAPCSRERSPLQDRLVRRGGPLAGVVVGRARGRRARAARY